MPLTLRLRVGQQACQLSCLMGAQSMHWYAHTHTGVLFAIFISWVTNWLPIHLSSHLDFSLVSAAFVSIFNILSGTLVFFFFSIFLSYFSLCNTSFPPVQLQSVALWRNASTLALFFRLLFKSLSVFSANIFSWKQNLLLRVDSFLRYLGTINCDVVRVFVYVIVCVLWMATVPFSGGQMHKFSIHVTEVYNCIRNGMHLKVSDLFQAANDDDDGGDEVKKRREIFQFTIYVYVVYDINALD